MKLSEYIDAEPRGAARRLAKAIEAHGPDVSRWISGERPIPAHRAAAIEQATKGQVTRQEMRPNDWQRIWPELAETSATHLVKAVRSRMGATTQPRASRA